MGKQDILRYFWEKSTGKVFFKERTLQNPLKQNHDMKILSKKCPRVFFLHTIALSTPGHIAEFCFVCKPISDRPVHKYLDYTIQSFD